MLEHHLPHALLLKMLLAIVIGGAIGLERELRSKSAGFRTLILICLGATMYTVFSQSLGYKTSPDRIASNVVVGIGFLGAGVIFKGESGVNGITTAASIWLTAALGIGIGIGWYTAAFTGCLIILTILIVFSSMDRVIDRANQVRQYRIVYPYEDNQQHKYEELIRHYHLIIRSRSQTKTANIIKGVWNVQGTEKNHHAFIERILKDSEVTEFSF